MNNSSKSAGGISWCWQRRVDPTQEEIWIERLQGAGCSSWVFTEKPNRRRLVLSVHAEKRAEIALLARKFGGKISSIKASAWLGAKRSAPLRIGNQFEVVHEKPQKKRGQSLPQLYVPQGMAFGSGEHATTLMLLQALARRSDWARTSMLDLGTGSGVLALAARLLGARKITATDFDAAAVRIARENEELNFSTPLIRWRHAEVKRLRAKTRYDLVLANLFSGILCEAAPQIAASVGKGGQLWLSGVLRSQQQEVIAAYRWQKLRLIRAVSRGKWMLIQWEKA